MKIKITLFLLLIGMYANATQITVCKTCAVKTIKEGLELVQAGDTLAIKKGIYKEHKLNVTKGIVILAEEGAVLDAEGKSGITVFKAHNFVLNGLKLINVEVSYTVDRSALKIIRTNDFVIENCTLENVFFGIMIERSKRGLIRNNKVSGNSIVEASAGNGVHGWKSEDLIISNNQLFKLRDGIYLEFVKNTEVHHNNSFENIRYGLHFMFSNNNVYHHNEFKNNGAGVAVMFSKFVTMHHNKFRLNWGAASYGLLLKEINDAEIYSNLFEENTIGINAEGSARINFKNNTFLGNGWAVKVRGACYTVNFENNNFSQNALDLAYNSKIHDNKFDGNYWSEYTGYDLDKDGFGDVPFRPVKLFSYIVNKTPEALVLLRSLFVDIINFSEKVSPVFTPDNLMDTKPLMQKNDDSYN